MLQSCTQLISYSKAYTSHQIFVLSADVEALPRAFFLKYANVSQLHVNF